MAAAALSTVTWVVAAMFEARFSFLNNDISDLGAVAAHHALLFNVGDSGSGILMIGPALTLVFFFGRRCTVVAGASLVAISGIGSFVDGLAREDCSVSINAACRAAEKAGRVSLHHKVHNIESLGTFIVSILAPLVLGLVFRSMRSWRRLGWMSIGAGLVQAICLPVFLTMYADGAKGQGLVEIVAATVAAAWIAAVSLAILHAGRDLGGGGQGGDHAGEPLHASEPSGTIGWKGGAGQPIGRARPTPGAGLHRLR